MVEKGFHPDCIACEHCTRSGLWKNVCDLYNVELPTDIGYTLCRKFHVRKNIENVIDQTNIVMSALPLDDVLYEWDMYSLANGQLPKPIMNLQYARDVSAE